MSAMSNLLQTRLLFGALLLLGLTEANAAIASTFNDANWKSMGGVPGVNGTVFASVADGLGNLYIGGEFSAVCDVPANRIAKWDGTNWSALGSGMKGGVNALAVSGSDLYVGGYFIAAGGITANCIAKWDGKEWSALSSGMTGGAPYGPAVYALAVSGSDVYAGGRFTNAGGTAANCIAKWSGSSWSELGFGLRDPAYPELASVRALAVSGSHLYAGGSFTAAGNTIVFNIAEWNGSDWGGVGTPPGLGGVAALAVLGGNLYAGGGLGLGKWDGRDWTHLINGNVVYALTVSGRDLYAGGTFTQAGGIAANLIAKWDGNAWSALGSGIGINFWVYALAVAGSDLYAGGDFTAAGGSTASHIAKWNGNVWSALCSGMAPAVLYPSQVVNALAVSGSNLYAGGEFITTSGGAANSIAKWDGNAWKALGSGVNSYVDALAAAGSNLYVGGWLSVATNDDGQGITVNNIAKWDGRAWSALGSGMNGFVYTLGLSGSDLYAGGAFSHAGDGVAHYIAKWDGRAWTALGSGMNSSVHALALSGNDLYAGGRFTTAGGIPANCVAKWDGTTWSALGSGIDGGLPGAVPIVLSLVVSGGDLYAAGQFTTAGGRAANHVAKWDGRAWSALGSGMDSSVYALALSGSDLYAGGYFTTADGIAASCIAKWNGRVWSALGSGIGDSRSGSVPSVNALVVSDSELYAGGYFVTAGEKVSAYVARAYLEWPTLSIRRDTANATLSWSTFYEAFSLQHSSEVANSNSWSNAHCSFTTNGAIKSATVPLTTSNRFFRLLGN